MFNPPSNQTIPKPVLNVTRKKRVQLSGFKKPGTHKQESIKNILQTPITNPETIYRYRDFVKRDQLDFVNEQVASKEGNRLVGRVKTIPKQSLEKLKQKAFNAQNAYIRELEAIAVAKRENRTPRKIFIEKRTLKNIPQDLATEIGFSKEDLKRDIPERTPTKRIKRTGLVKEDPNPLVALPPAAETVIPEGVDTVELITVNQNVSEYVVRFHNPRGWEGLYAKIEDILDEYEDQGLVNVRLGFYNEAHIKFQRTIVAKHLNSMEQFFTWIQNIFSENVTGSDKEYDGTYEVVTDVFEFLVIKGTHIEEGKFSSPVLPVLNLCSEPGECVKAVTRYLDGDYSTAITDKWEELLLKGGKTLDNLIILSEEFKFRIIENRPVLGKKGLTRKKLTHMKINNEWIPRECIKIGTDEPFYQLRQDELVYKYLSKEQTKTTEYAGVGYGDVLYGDTLTGDTNGESKRLTQHIDIIGPERELSNVYFNGSDFNMLEVNNEEPIKNPVIVQAKDSHNEVFINREYMKILVSYDLETVIDYNEGCMFKTYSCSFVTIPMHEIEYTTYLARPEYRVNLLNLQKFKTQRIPKLSYINLDDYEPEEFDEKPPYDIMGEEYLDKPYLGPGIQVDTRYKNMCVVDGYATINLYDKTVEKPVGKWKKDIDSPMDLLYETCFKTTRANTLYKFIGFNNTAFDNLFWFEYGQARSVLESVDVEAVKFVKPLFVKGLLNMQMQEPNGIVHDVWDLVKHIPGSLKKLSKKWGIGALCKSTLDHNVVQRAYYENRFPEFIRENLKSIQDYNSLDCLAPLAICAKYQQTLLSITPVVDMLKYHKKGLFDIMTIGSLTNNITKLTAEKNGVIFKPLPFCLYEDVRNSAVAGRCDLVNGPCVIVGKIASLDIKSAYPYVCCVGPYYFPHGNIVFSDYNQYKQLPTKPRTRTDYDDGRPLGFFYGTVDWSNLEVNPGLAMKTPTGNDWKTKIFDTWVSTEYIHHLLENGCLFTPKNLLEAKLKEVSADYYEVNGECPNIPEVCNGFVFQYKCKGVKIFSHILEFMKIKNKQDEHKEIVNKYVDIVNERYINDIGVIGSLDYGITKYLSESEQEEYSEAAGSYNQSLRETCKLMSNAATGKPMEDIHVEKYKMLPNIKDFWKLKASEKLGKITDLVPDRIHESGLVVHYKINKKDKQLTQNPFYVTSLIYDYTRIKLYNDTYKTLPNPNRGIYSDTDSTKIRDFTENGVNDSEYVLEKLSKIPLPYCVEALECDPRLKEAYLTTPNIYGTYENEFPDKERNAGEEQSHTVFYQKKFNICIGKKGGIISSTAKGVNMGRDVLVSEENIHRIGCTDSIESHHWVVESNRPNRQGIEKTHYKLVNGLSQAFLHNHLMMKSDRKETMCSSASLNGLIRSAQSHGSAYILSAPFNKHLRNMKRSGDTNPNTHDDRHMTISANVSLKRLSLQKFTYGL